MSDTPKGASNEMDGIKMPANSKANRYYYRNREKVLARRKELRLLKKGEKAEEPYMTTEEKAKLKREFILGQSSK